MRNEVGVVNAVCVICRPNSSPVGSYIIVNFIKDIMYNKLYEIKL